MLKAKNSPRLNRFTRVVPSCRLEAASQWKSGVLQLPAVVPCSRSLTSEFCGAQENLPCEEDNRPLWNALRLSPPVDKHFSRISLAATF